MSSADTNIARDSYNADLTKWVTWTTAATSTIKQMFTVSSPQLWSVASPNLYQVRVDVKIGGATGDTYLAPLGFRTPAFDANAGFSLNGQSVNKSRWTTAPMAHILPHWNWSTGTTVTVYVYNNCDSVELFLNNASQGSKAMSGGALRAEWSVAWASGTLRADCKVGSSVVVSDQVTTAGAAAKVVLTADRSTINADGRDLVFVTGDIQDGSGVFVPTAASSVSFAVAGPGQLVGVDNGNPIDTTSYQGTSRNAFSGKVLAIVRSTGTAGTITITASASGLTSSPVPVAAQ